MRKIILSALFIAGTTNALFAQNLDDIQKNINSGKFSDAREKIDKIPVDSKVQNNSAYWYSKAKIYHNLSNAGADSATSAVALDAIKKYFELESGDKDEAKRYINSMIENHKIPYEVYAAYANNGVKAFQEKNWNKAYYDFTKSLEAFDVLSKNKITPAPFDTTMNLYAGIAAQNAGLRDDAAAQYKKIIDANIRDTAYAELYEYMVLHYDDKKDSANLTKYLQLGKQQFPKRELWLQYDVQRLSSDGATRLSEYQNLVTQNPANYNLRYNYVAELFKQAYDDNAKNSSDLPAKKATLKTAIDELIAVDPSLASGYYVMTQYFSNEIYDAQVTANAIRGTKPEDVQRKKQFTTAINTNFEAMLPYATKAEEAYSSTATLKSDEKANYKKVLDNLVEYYEYKKQPEKAKLYQDKIKGIR